MNSKLLQCLFSKKYGSSVFSKEWDHPKDLCGLVIIMEY